MGGVGGLIDNLTSWRYIRARYAQPPLQNLARTPMSLHEKIKLIQAWTGDPFKGLAISEGKGKFIWKFIWKYFQGIAVEGDPP